MLNEQRDKPIAIEYLESLGVHVSTQVKLVLVTHWHDDHIRGVSDVVRAASSARFACSAAVNSEAFFRMIAAEKSIKLVGHTSGVAEFAEVLAVKNRGPDHWAHEGMVLYAGTSSTQVKVHALSPSAHTVTDAMGNFARTILSLNKAIQPFPCVTPNDHSIVLLVETQGIHLLLGGDLEKGADARRGWKAVVASAVRPNVRSVGYKVAHHGSETSDVDEIWTHLTVSNPRALLTPYARGRKPLPSASDVKRLKAKSDHVYCTVWPQRQTPPGRPVDRTMNEVARNRRIISKRPGHIRLRVPLDGKTSDIVVDLFDRARKI